ncbi:cation efflux system protein CusC [Candidatus Phycosocius bacilliformis]|uniref:Cation efflux system protein CusC n=1 Tax=Candidatus Phycosocius bacilliformis TaxID=1445552 RepID=A0A2P2E796_9PROT|nr:efflux transporter outer membrane subunit [Candidatus Phycosocius bacilliformis]GBF56936.1 cation efflux system protein CusC [Candidatus Phycosocius bacilliformis]
MSTSAAKFRMAPLSQNFRRVATYGSLVGLAALGGCAADGNLGFPALGAPKVAAQVSELPDAFRDMPPAPAGDSAAWWASFADPTLDQLVRAALAESISVQLANQRLIEARNTGRSTIAGFAPRLTATGAADTEYAVGDNRLTSATGDKVVQQTTGSANVRATWEVPLFGRFGSALAGAKANEAGARASLEAAKIAIIADLAAAYVDLRNAQQSLAYLTEDLARADAVANIASAREAAGLISRADKGLSQGQAAQLRQRVPDAELRVRGALDRIAILRGVVPGSLDQLLAPVKDFTFRAEAPTVDAVPANFVRRRLDVARAEQDAILQAAAVGIARADMYPSLSIVGTITSLSSLAGNPLAQAAVETASSTPAISIPLFDLGQRRASLRTANARFEQALLSYRSTTLNAIAEGQNALSAYEQAKLRAAAGLEAERAAEVRFNATLASFNAGLASFQDRLEAESALATARQSRLASQAQLSDAAIGLYRTFAGSPGI